MCKGGGEDRYEGDREREEVINWVCRMEGENRTVVKRARGKEAAKKLR